MKSRWNCSWLREREGWYLCTGLNPPSACNWVLACPAFPLSLLPSSSLQPSHENARSTWSWLQVAREGGGRRFWPFRGSLGHWLRSPGAPTMLCNRLPLQLGLGFPSSTTALTTAKHNCTSAQMIFVTTLDTKQNSIFKSSLMLKTLYTTLYFCGMHFHSWYFSRVELQHVQLNLCQKLCTFVVNTCTCTEERLMAKDLHFYKFLWWFCLQQGWEQRYGWDDLVPDDPDKETQPCPSWRNTILPCHRSKTKWARRSLQKKYPNCMIC